MGEALEKFYSEPIREKNDKKESLELIFKHLEEIGDFFHSDYVIKTRKQSFGFNKPKQFEALMKIRDLRQKLLNFSQKDIEIVKGNHMAHILGNSITTSAGGFAKRFEDGKYFSEEGEEKPFPVEKFETMKSEMELMFYYIDELLKEDSLIVEEMGSGIGYLKNFVNYLVCDLPSQTTEQLKLFRFFRELETGTINQENFSAYAEKVEKYLDMENVRKLIKL